MTLIDGSRKKPVAMSTNKYGCTNDLITTVDGESLYVQPDDLGLHSFDRSRLLPLLRAVIGPDLHYQFTADLESLKCTKIFAALATYIRGQSAKNVTIAIKNLQLWTLSPGRPVLRMLKTYLTSSVKWNLLRNVLWLRMPKCLYYNPSYLAIQDLIY